KRFARKVPCDWSCQGALQIALWRRLGRFGEVEELAHELLAELLLSGHGGGEGRLLAIVVLEKGVEEREALGFLEGLTPEAAAEQLGDQSQLRLDLDANGGFAEQRGEKSAVEARGEQAVEAIQDAEEIGDGLRAGVPDGDRFA